MVMTSICSINCRMIPLPIEDLFRPWIFRRAYLNTTTGGALENLDRVNVPLVETLSTLLLTYLSV